MATKQQMIDFINGRYVYNGKKLPKSRLARCSEEELMTLIKTNPKGLEAFENYVATGEGLPPKKRSSVSKQEAPCKPSQEKEGELERLVCALAEDPTSFLAIHEFRSFLRNLPYGCVSFNKLKELIDKIMEIDTPTAVLLLNYSVKQETYLDKFNDQKT